MEKRISKWIYDLYEIKENPVQYLEKIRPILEGLIEFGIEFPGFPRYQSYSSSIQRISVPMQAFSLLQECLQRFLSEEQLSRYDDAREIRDLTFDFQSKLNANITNLRNQYELLRLKITDENKEYFEDLLQKLIGIRLEYELIPNLFEKMGFKKNSTAFKIEGKIIEVDGRFEKTTHHGAREERLVGKHVVIVECKASIDSDEIKRFESKANTIKGMYDKDKENWSYDDLDFRAWIVACYGWNEELIKEAESRGIVAITPSKLEDKLKQNRIFDSRIPVCPNSHPTP